ncbi:MAG: leucine-rich repeat domain-containing protein [Bacteroidaceae bacterium]|nr:leucine-rich repeat domain-containing protein [Bacteroidaceae bacterium]
MIYIKNNAVITGRFLIMISLLWLLTFNQTFAGLRFIENGFEYTSLYPGPCGQYSVNDTIDVVMLRGCISPFSFDSNHPLYVPAFVEHNGKKYKVKEIGGYALAGLPCVETIIIEDGIEVLSNYAICYCSNLKSVYIPASVRALGYKLFVYCPNLTELVVDPKNKNYDSRDYSNAICFDDELLVGCNGTRIPSTIREIGADAFFGRNAMETIVIPEGVSSIGPYAFGCCSGLKRVSLPLSLTEIRECSFENCSSLDSVFIPRHVSQIRGENIFAGCNRLSSIIVDEENEYYDSRSNCNGIVRTSDSTLVAACSTTSLSHDVSRLEDGCFNGVNFHSFRLPKTMEKFNANSFFNCGEIDFLTVDSDNPKYTSPENSNVILTKDGKTLVMGCRTSIIPDGIESIEEDAFWARYTNSFLKLPEGLKNIQWGAFRDCNKICNLSIPSSVINIGELAFSGCCNIVEICIPEGVKTIGDGSFENCERVVAIHLPSSLEVIGSSSFRNCKRLNEIFFPDSVREVGIEVCKNCVNLKHVYLPPSIVKVRNGAFENCRSLAEICIPEGVQEIVFDTFRDCVKMERIHLPSSLGIIGQSAFLNCKNLTELTIPEGVKKIEKQAFKDCVNLKRIKLPSTIERIEDDAFSGCPCEKSVKRFLKHKK